MTILGIDLGTTNSLVATLVNGKPETLANELGEHLTPSAVAIAEDGALLVGRPAWDRLVSAPNSGRAFFKRDMGTASQYTFGGRTWLPVECSALVLTEMRRVAQLHLGAKVNSAVITVPAYFRESQRQATVEAAHLAGLAVARIVNEPTAAALAYGLGDPGRDQRQLVFDLGGGTFDVTVLEQFAGVVEVRASGGDGRLGGEDYTDLLLDLLLRRCGLDRQAPDLGAKRAKVESVKRRLSAQDRVGLVLAGNELVVTRGDFEQATLELTARLRPIVHRCLRDAKIAANELDAVLLVGGATRMHMIQDFVRHEFGKAGIAVLDPDRVVALGAAVQAGLAAGDAAVQDLVLTDVSAHTLGIETTKQLAPGHKLSGYFTPIIERNTTVPVSRAKRFDTLTSEQDEILLKIYQGEGRQTKDNHLLGNLTISGLRRPHPETASIEVRFSYDMSGLLEVDVLVLHSGVKFHTVIEERPGSLNSRQMEEIRARLAPLKFLARERLQNRARLERANRVYTQLLGEPRAILDHLVTQFEALLETAPEAIWEACGKQLDEFLAQFPLEEGHWQPPTGDAGPSS